MNLNELLKVVNDDNVIEIIEYTKTKLICWTRELTKKDLHYFLSLDKIINKKVTDIKIFNGILLINIGNLKIDF